MNARAIVEKQIERESKYLSEQAVGTDEYNASLERLCTLEDKLVALDRSNEDKRDRVIRYGLDVTKIVVTTSLSIFGIVALTAEEREITYRSALKGLINNVLPGKMKF